MNTTLHDTRQPLVRSARLVLRPAGRAQLDELLALWREPEVCRYLGEGTAPTREQALQRLALYLGLASEGLGLWTVHRVSDGAALGCVSLQRGPRPGSLEPAAALSARWRGLGYAQEALVALLAHATEALGAQDFVAHCCVPDQDGDRLLRRLGFVPCYESEAGRYRVRQYRPGARHSDTGVLTRLLRRGQRATALPALAA